METQKLTALRRWGGGVFTVVILMLCICQTAVAEERGYKVHAQFGAYTHFGGSSDDYEGPPILGNLELNSPQDWLFGLSLFNNSFGQFSQYLYAGKKWRLPSIQKYLHVKLTGGVVHGYVDEFEDKIPLNHNGWAPGIIPSIGFKKDRLAVDLVIFGTAGVMLAVGYDIWDF